MVDSIGWKAGGVSRITASTPIAPVAKATNGASSEPIAAPVATESTRLAKSLAAAPPVDTDRVAQIRQAIADGKFPLSPSTVADRLIALKLEWKSNDQA